MAKPKESSPNLEKIVESGVPLRKGLAMGMGKEKLGKPERKGKRRKGK